MKINKKHLLFKITFLGLFLAGGIIYSVVDRKNIKTANKEYFEKFNESFEGKILSVENVESIHRCLIELELDKSSIDFYDIRNTNDIYYVVIKDNHAEIINDILYQDYPESGNKIKKGQYFRFDGRTDTAYLYQENILIDKWKPQLSNFQNFKIRKKHKIK